MRLFFLISMLLCSGHLFGQDQDLEARIQDLKLQIKETKGRDQLKWRDSLSQIIWKARDARFEIIAKPTIKLAFELDSINVAAYHTTNLINFYNNTLGNPKKGLAFFDSIFPKFQNKKITDRNMAGLYLDSGDCHYFMGNRDKAIAHYQKAQVFARKSGDERVVAFTILYQGYAYNDDGAFVKASQTLQEASRIFQKVKDTFNIIGVKNSLAILYSKNMFLKEAKEEREGAIALSLLSNNNGSLISLYYNAASDYNKIGAQKERIESLKMALTASRKSEFDTYFEPILLNELVVSYAQNDSLSKANEYLQMVEKEERNTKGLYLGNYLKAKKNLALAKGEIAQALSYGKEYLALKRTENKIGDIKNGEKFLADIYQEIGNTELAFNYFKRYTAIKDSISNVQKVKALAYYQTLYETEKRDLKIASQESTIALLDARNKIKTQWFLVGGIGLLFVFGALFFWRSKRAAKKRQILQEGFSQDLINEREEERTRIARELHDSVGQKLMLLTKKTTQKEKDDVSSLAKKSLQEIRSIARGLYPSNIENLGISVALKTMLNEIDGASEVFITHDIAEIDGVLSLEKQLHLFRIVQESFNNIMKHSQAKAAFVGVAKNEEGIQVKIEDNGKGFLTSEIFKNKNLGMKTLKERAKIIHSTLEVTSTQGRGTQIQLFIPA